MFDLPVLDHCQDYSVGDRRRHARRLLEHALGLRGWPAAVKR